MLNKIIGWSGRNVFLVLLATLFVVLGGIYAVFMLASAPLFAGSFLITKALSRRDRPEVIVVWQSITVSMFSFPMAVLHWSWPTLGQWALFMLCGVIGTAGHYFSNRALRATDVSATQSIKFLDLIWAVLAGLSVFGDVPSSTTMLGGRTSRSQPRSRPPSGRVDGPVLELAGGRGALWLSARHPVCRSTGGRAL